ncbi:MAG: hypothetical protein WDO56_20525 [Gammaproteobacteria bacterium]
MSIAVINDGRLAWAKGYGVADNTTGPRARGKDVSATPSEYIRDLIRRDMQDRAVALNALRGWGTRASTPIRRIAGCEAWCWQLAVRSEDGCSCDAGAGTPTLATDIDTIRGYSKPATLLRE